MGAGRFAKKYPPASAREPPSRRSIPDFAPDPLQNPWQRRLDPLVPAELLLLLEAFTPSGHTSPEIPPDPRLFQAVTNGNPGGKLPVGKGAARLPAFSFAAAVRKAARNSE